MKIAANGLRHDVDFLFKTMGGDELNIRPID
jgi:hypothetical protein